MNVTLETLDPVILHRCLLAPVLGIHCPRSDKRLVYVCGDKGWCELERRVRSGEAAVAFLLRNVSVVQVMAVADAGHLLPPKVLLACTVNANDQRSSL